MKVQLSRGDGSQPLAPEQAILIYGQGGKQCYASLNPIRITQEGPEIGAGRGLTREALRGLARELAGLSQRREILPEHVLFADGTRTLWYRKAERRPVFFHTGRKAFDQAMRAASALYPPVLFLGVPGRLYVWALASDDRPETNTQLYRPPFLNIYQDGAMCTGTAKLPREITTDVRVFERAFFETTFTHSNLGGHALAAYPGGHDALWRRLKQKGAPDWKAWLVPLKDKHLSTVGDALNLEVRNG